jgi:hypothetical protein
LDHEFPYVYLDAREADPQRLSQRSSRKVREYHRDQLPGRVGMPWWRSTSQTFEVLWPVMSELCLVARPTLRYRSLTRPTSRGAGWGKRRASRPARRRSGTPIVLEHGNEVGVGVKGVEEHDRVGRLSVRAVAYGDAV